MCTGGMTCSHRELSQMLVTASTKMRLPLRKVLLTLSVTNLLRMGVVLNEELAKKYKERVGNFIKQVSLPS